MNPDIFKAYDVRALYPQELDEATARQIGRGFVTYLKAKRIAVSRDMRLSSPSLAEAFIEGALGQGADVVDYGMMATDMLYYVVATEKLEGGAQITASHNPSQYNGVKMVRAEAMPLSGCTRLSSRARFSRASSAVSTTTTRQPGRILMWSGSRPAFCARALTSV